MVEQLFRKQQVDGSNPSVGSIFADTKHLHAPETTCHERRRPMLIAKNQEVELLQLTTVEGHAFTGNVTMKVMIPGEKMNMLEIRYPAGSRSPTHAHRHESVCYVISGRIRGTIEGESVILGPGDACRHPEGVEHSVEALEDALILEIKSPAQPLDQFLGPR